ncbi:MAG: ABC transporter substrate-binding protein [Deferrisomatales bacterium]
MGRKSGFTARAVTLCALVLFGAGAPAQAVLTPANPAAKPDGTRWRIAYLEGGAYPDYQVIFKAIVVALAEKGWLDDPGFSEPYDPDHRAVWERLADGGKSRYVEFVRDAFYSSNFDPELRVKTRAELLRRLTERKDIDLVIAMGTWAGQDLANDEHSVPTIVASTSDPVGAGIVAGAADSGRDHLHAKVDPTRYETQVLLFHDIAGFRRLGLVFEDTPEGRSYAAVPAVEKAAAELGFEVVTCSAPFSGVEQPEAVENVLRCHEELAPRVDALYLTVHRGVTLQDLPRLLEPLVRRKVKTFSQLGTQQVRHGVLFSVAQSGYRPVAGFHAHVIAQVFNGKKPRAMPQLWQDPAQIAINLKAAAAIGYTPPVDILLVADEIYESIEVAQ